MLLCCSVSRVCVSRVILGITISDASRHRHTQAIADRLDRQVQPGARAVVRGGGGAPSSSAVIGRSGRGPEPIRKAAPLNGKGAP